MEAKKLDINELRKEFKQKKKDVAKLRSQLNSLGRVKEEAYGGVKDTRDRVKSLTGQIGKLRRERDKFTKSIKEMKEERDKLNSTVKEKASERKDADQKRKVLLNKLDVKEDPARLKKTIENMEEKLETEVMPFPKEEALRKQIKELKVKYKQVAGLAEVWKQANTVTTDLSQARKKAQELHEKIQKTAQESQERHEQMNKLYDEIKKLRKADKPMGNKYADAKTKYMEVKKQLEEMLKRVKELNVIIQEEDQKKHNDEVDRKTAAVEEKLKKRKKLSTEDILAFQAKEEK